MATVGEKLGLGDAVLRRILNHTAPKSDVLHRHYVGLSTGDVAGAMVGIQEALVGLMGSNNSINLRHSKRRLDNRIDVPQREPELPPDNGKHNKCSDIQTK